MVRYNKQMMDNMEKCFLCRFFSEEAVFDFERKLFENKYDNKRLIYFLQLSYKMVDK